MKRSILVLVASIGMLLQAAPVKSNMGARQSSFIYSEDGISAKSYVQDGLVALWDGIENVGWGVHEDSPAAWIDVVYGLVLTYGNTISFEQNSVCNNFTGAKDMPAFMQMENDSLSTALLNGASITIEICEDSTSTQSFFIWRSPLIQIATDDSQGSALYIQQNYNRYLTRGIFGRFNIEVVFNWHTLSVCSDMINRSGIVYMNGGLLRTYTYGTLSPQTAIPLKIGITNKMYCIRIYNRQLAEGEIAHNHLIDKKRFGL